MQRTRRTAMCLARSLAWSACLLVLVTACSDDPAAPADAAPSAGAPSPPVPELQPGAPGEDTTTREPDQPLEETDAAHEDVAFMQMMVLHHRQALDMAGLVGGDRTDNRQLDLVALRISAAQAAEILVMAQWLTEGSLDVPAPDADPADYDHAQHGHSGMRGMLSEAELAELADARGAAFDRLFLVSTIRHHEGAIAMAEYVLTHGADQRVAELATDVIAEQGAEIARLEEMLAGA